MNILIADAHQRIVQDLMFGIRKILPGAKCTGASETDEITELCENEKFDIVFMDTEISGTSGITLAAKILSLHPKTNIIYISAREEYAYECFKTYPSAFLLKPITESKLKDALDNLRYPVSDITDEQIISQYAGNAVIGKKIEKFRKERSLSRNELAELMGVTMPTVFRWENGDRLPDIVTFMKLARILGVNYDHFMHDEIES